MCGIIGVISKENRSDLGSLIAFGLYQEQNRGDFSAGIATIRKLPFPRRDYRRGRMIATEHAIQDFDSLAVRKSKGRVSEAFNKEGLEKLVGFMGVGQVRYPTAGYTRTEADDTINPQERQEMLQATIQPISNPWSRISMVHNGDIHNYHEIMEHFAEDGLRRAGHNDLEAVLKVFSEEFFDMSENIADSERVAKTVQKVFERVKGTYSALATVNNVGIVAFRDPNGRRPLIFGVRRDKEGVITDYAFASETVALEKMLFKGTSSERYADGRFQYEEVPPGSMMFVGKDFDVHKMQLVDADNMPCPFEGTYFARASSFINGKRVKEIRRDIIANMWNRFMQTGAYQRIMEYKDQVKDGVVIVAVPRTAETAAKHLSNLTHIPLEDAIEKTAFAPRIFQQPTQEHRVKQTTADHYIFDEYIRDKIVLLIEDSIVRGTTLQEDVKYLKDLGVKEIHAFITFPPIRHPCMHAIDFHTENELIAHGKTIDEVKSALGLSAGETLMYATADEIRRANGYEQIHMCNECYLNGEL